MTRPTKVEIIVPALLRNLALIRGQAGGKSGPVEVIAVVKADAYGHGAVEVSRVLVRERVRWLAVACLEEALELEAAGLLGEARALVLAPMQGDEARELAERGFVAMLTSLSDFELIESLESAGVEPPSLAVVIDTGMGRMGLLPEEVSEAVRRLRSRPGRRVIGLFSHFPVADSFDEDNLEFTRRQLEDFRLLFEAMHRNFPGLSLVSIANSAGIFFHSASLMRAVRPGISLYGARPEPELAGPEGLSPVMRWVTRIAQVRELPAGASISYGRRTVLTRRSRVALLPAGYADGLNRRLPPGFPFLVHGKPAPILGTITMDFTMIDVTDIPSAAPGDRVLLMGREPEGGEVRAEDHARAAGTIPYEILTSVGKRVPRIYLKEEEA